MAGVPIHRDRAYKSIRSWIAGGVLKPGRRLSDVDLAKKIGVSRTPVREAISRLESEGLIEQVPRFGAFVRQLDRKEFEDLSELRILLEGYAAERAATRITEADLETLGRIVERLRAMVHAMRDAGQSETTARQSQEWVALDIAFHMIIVRASGNDQVSKIIAGYRLMANLYRAKPVSAEAFLRVHASTWASHMRILRALRRRDGQAARYWMSRHIERAKNRALLGYDQKQEPDKADSGAWPSDIPSEISDLIAYAERYTNEPQG